MGRDLVHTKTCRWHGSQQSRL